LTRSLPSTTLPSEVAEHSNFTLPAVSAHLCVLKEADLVTEKRQGTNRFYSLNRSKSLEVVKFLEEMYDYNLNSLKEYVENKEKKRKKEK
jgi:ArsR family transcriptional regulator, arsenate/arsenite/antimonite-responsive transcriptional repressor